MAELNTSEVTAGGDAPESWLLMLHGIYGAGRNWRSVAKSLVDARPEWGVVLADLRQHGGSQGFDPPHTIEAAAADLDGIEVAGEVKAVMGHSFGGKVALAHAASRESVEQVWVVDSTPAVREPEGSAWNMLRILRALPEEFDERETAVEALVERRVSRPIALWMTSNLDRTDDGRYRWAIDLDDMEALLRDFFRTDLWHVVEEPPARLTVHLIRATESSILGDADQERIRAAAMRTGRVWLHEVEGGHWLNADNPDAVVALLAAEL